MGLRATTTLDPGGGGEATLIANAITIANRSNTLMAPESITFRVDPDTLTTPLGIAAPTGAYDARLSEPTFFWTFGDSYQFTSSVNTATHNSGTALGAAAQHTYRQAGTYNVRLDIYTWSGGHWYSETTVTVNAFSGTTITVGPSGRDYTTLDAAISAMLGSEAGFTRIVLDRGQTYSFSGVPVDIISEYLVPSFQIVAADGAGANPIVNCSDSFTIYGDASALPEGSKDMVFQNIDWRGDWNSADNVGNYDASFLIGTVMARTPGTILFDGGAVRNFSLPIYLTRTTQTPIRVILNDCFLHDWAKAGYFCFRCAEKIATGSAIVQNVNARIAPSGPGIEYSGGPPWRGDAALEIMNQCDGFSRTGWSPTTTVRRAYQSFRFNADGRENTETYISENFIESGYRLVTFGAEQNEDDAISAPKPQRALQFEANVLVANWQNNQMVYSRVGGAHFRNNLFIWPASVDNDGTVVPVINQSNTNGREPYGIPENLISPIYAYNNTIVNLRSSGSAGVLQHDTTGGSFTSITVANNIVHEPNKVAPVVADAPLVDDGAVLMTPRELGYRYEDGTWEVLDQASPATTAYTFAPETGSAALGDATGSVIAPLTRTNAVRPSPASRGASEAA